MNFAIKKCFGEGSGVNGNDEGCWFNRHFHNGVTNCYGSGNGNGKGFGYGYGWGESSNCLDKYFNKDHILIVNKRRKPKDMLHALGERFGSGNGSGFGGDLYRFKNTHRGYGKATGFGNGKGFGDSFTSGNKGFGFRFGSGNRGNFGEGMGEAVLNDESIIQPHSLGS